jgi:uncharacterized protein
MTTQHDLTANKARVKAYLTALSSMRLDEARAMMHPECDCIIPTISLKPNRFQRDEMLAFVGGVKDALPGGIRFEFEDFTAEEDRVSAIANGFAKTIEGAEYNNTYHFLITLRDGKVIKHLEYMDSFLAGKVMGPLLAKAMKGG